MSHHSERTKTLKTVLDCHEPPRPVRVSCAGQSSPAVRYALACLLTARSEQDGDPWRRQALREVRAVFELRNPWAMRDPYVQPLVTDAQLKYAFHRIAAGPNPQIEWARFNVGESQGTMQKPVVTTLKLRSVPLTEERHVSERLSVEFAVGKPHSDPSSWKPWRTMRFKRQSDSAVVYEGSWLPDSPGEFWLLGRARLDAGKWIHVDAIGYDVTDPMKHGLSEPATITVKKKAPPSTSERG